MIYDLEPRQFVYNRTGNLAATTTVNEEAAEKFMRVSDLRRDIVIVDSGKKPEANTVAVKSDTLAFRAVAPISELTKIVLKPKQFHETEIVDNQYIVSIHDRIIDDDIRKKNYQDREDYENQYLRRLKHEVKDAAAEVLFAEKLGFSDQKINYFLYFPQIPILLANIPSKNVSAFVAELGLIAFLHSFLNARDNMRIIKYKILQKYADTVSPGYRVTVPPWINSRSWQQIFYPVVPIDRWIKGRRFLAEHGEELISSKVNPAEKIG